MLVKHSCTTRNMAISVSFGNRPSSGAISRCTSIRLRFANPSVYHRNADASPASSSSGGCSKCEIVRISLLTSSTNPAFSATHFAAAGLKLPASAAITAMFIPIAAISCPTLSCSSRASRLCSSSRIRSSRADKSRKLSVAMCNSSVRSRTRFSRSSRASLNDSSNCRCSSMFVAVPYHRVTAPCSSCIGLTRVRNHRNTPSSPRSGNSISNVAPVRIDDFQRSKMDGSNFASCTALPPDPSICSGVVPVYSYHLSLRQKTRPPLFAIQHSSGSEFANA